MKKFLVFLLAFVSLSVFAQHGYGYRPHPRAVWMPNMGWAIPTLVGGAIVYEVIKGQQPATVVIEKQVVCTEWKEIQTSDGKTYRERSCREENLK